VNLSLTTATLQLKHWSPTLCNSSIFYSFVSCKSKNCLQLFVFKCHCYLLTARNEVLCSNNDVI